MEFLCKFIFLYISSLGKPVMTADTGYNAGADNLWSHYGDTCYSVHSEPKTFAEAAKFCKNMNDDGHLAQIRDNDHNNHIAEQLQKHENIESAMFGLKFYQREKIYAYGMNAYQTWYPRQPSNSGGKEDCTEMITDAWNDIPCHLKRSYMCEKPSDDKTSVDCDGWKRFGSKMVKFFRNPLTWDAAYNECKKYPGGKLVEMRSYEEESLVKSIGKRRRYHIGYRKYNRGSKIWGWNKENPWTVDEWESQEIPTSEDNACISVNEAGYWTRISCNEKHPFVCSRVDPGVSKTKSPNNQDYKGVSFGKQEEGKENSDGDQSLNSYMDEMVW